MARFLDMFLENFRGRRFVAVDLDSRFMRLVHAEQSSRQVRVLKTASTPLPEGTDITDAKAIGELLGKALKDNQMGGEPLLMNVSRGQAVLKSLSLPANVARDELAGMVQYQVEKELPFRPEEAVIDFTSEDHVAPDAPPAGGGTNVLVAAVRLPVVEHFRQVAALAGTKLLRLGLRPYANVRCLGACGLTHDAQRQAFVYIGSDETEIDVLAGRSLSFSRSVVAKILPGDPSAQADSVNVLVAEVVRTLQSYQTAEGSGKIEQVFIAGGTGLERQLADELAKRLACNCQLINPPKSMGLFDDGHASAFSAALGLAVAQSAEGQLPFDFVNHKRPVVRRDMKKIRIAAMVAFGVAVLASLLVVNAMYLDGLRRSLDQKNAELASLQKADKKLEATINRVRAVDAWVKSEPNWLDHWAALSVLLPSADDAYIQYLRTTKDNAIEFQIRVRDDKTLGEMIRQLNYVGYTVTPASVGPVKDQYGYIQEQMVSLKIGSLSNATTMPTTQIADLRPTDDMSAEVFGRNNKTEPKPPVLNAGASASAAVPDNNAPNNPPRNLAQGNSGGANQPDGNYTEVGFDAIKRGAPGVDKFKGTQLTIRGRVAESLDKYLLADAPADRYAAIKLNEGGRNTKRFIYVYVPKDSPLMDEFRKRQDVKPGAGTRYIKMAGRAYYTGNEPEDCPVCVIVDKVVQ